MSILIDNSVDKVTDSDMRFVGTGTAELKVFTPLIQTIFSPYHIDVEHLTSEKDGEYIYVVISFFDDNIPTWESYREQFILFAKTLKIDVMKDSSIKDVINLLPKEYKVSEDKLNVFLHKSFDDDFVNNSKNRFPGLGLVFTLAQLLDDGHGLQSVSFQGAQYLESFDVEIDAYSGDAEYHGKHFSRYMSTFDCEIEGESIDSSLEDASTSRAAYSIASSVYSMLNIGLTDATLKPELLRKIGEYLIESSEQDSKLF